MWPSVFNTTEQVRVCRTIVAGYLCVTRCVLETTDARGRDYVCLVVFGCIVSNVVIPVLFCCVQLVLLLLLSGTYLPNS